MGKRLKYLLIIGLLFTQSVFADSVTKPHTWVDGETPTAALWNANEDAIIAGVNSVSSSQIVDGTLVNADISGSAAIAYSKLTLTNSVVSADIAADTIVNSDINSAAAIVDTKLDTISTAGKVSAAALTSLSSTPSGAGVMPVANLGSGSPTSSTVLTGDGAWTTLSTTITGEVRMWTTATPPSGWLLCDGSAVSRSTYSALFAVVSTTFGVGDGSTTFNVPNFTNKIAYGASTGSSAGNADVGSANTPASMVLAGNDSSVTYKANVSQSGNGTGNPDLIYNTNDFFIPYLAIYYIIKT